MKNVTVTLDEEVAQWARVWAARHATSVSRMLGELLRERMLEEDTYETAMQAFLAEQPVALKQSGRYPTRDELHDHPLLR
jgi:plasmid stability protein